MCFDISMVDPVNNPTCGLLFIYSI